jgi:hypothetical protein
MLHDRSTHAGPPWSLVPRLRLRGASGIGSGLPSAAGAASGIVLHPRRFPRSNPRPVGARTASPQPAGAVSPFLRIRTMSRSGSLTDDLTETRTLVAPASSLSDEAPFRRAASTGADAPGGTEAAGVCGSVGGTERCRSGGFGGNDGLRADGGGGIVVVGGRVAGAGVCSRAASDSFRSATARASSRARRSSPTSPAASAARVTQRITPSVSPSAESAVAALRRTETSGWSEASAFGGVPVPLVSVMNSPR